MASVTLFHFTLVNIINFFMMSVFYYVCQYNPQSYQ